MMIRIINDTPIAMAAMTPGGNIHSPFVLLVVITSLEVVAGLVVVAKTEVEARVEEDARVLVVA